MTSSFRGRRIRLLASGELPAVGGRARLLAVEGGRVGGPGYGAVAARGTPGPLGTAVGMPAVVWAGEGCWD